MPGIAPIASYPMPAVADLPSPIAPWTPDPRRAVLLIHDMQEYFLRPFDATGSPRRELVGNVTRLRECCAGLGIPVAYTAQPGGMTTAERGLLADFWGPGMRTTASDRAVVAPLRPAPGDWQLTKWRYSAFFRSALRDRIREQGRDQLIVCGVYAHVGVLSTAMEAFTNDIQAFVVSDAVADFSAEQHRLALDYTARTCAVVQPTGWLLARLQEAAR
ncbi:isochorismatase family protein [Actinoplanes utahensis]|uniref:Isochorismatase n=1 Tax=Actinoplanes utahensis TaxID=1869 RepID=A0A0A6UL51_ACTUT|nr:isochorismatase family protein [Actinoplanes utahensis]KHD76835.1 isochorismatase [Actinoplanes utahensis]GIF33422.1 phenazine biosynthesis protein PhzD [Actinoplanes utahensis]